MDKYIILDILDDNILLLKEVDYKNKKSITHFLLSKGFAKLNKNASEELKKEDLEYYNTLTKKA